MDLCELVRCALSNETPDFEGMDFKAVHKLAKYHTLTAISYMALEGTEAENIMEPELSAKWKQEKDMAIRKNLRLSTERMQILAEMEKMGCWYMPLKGSILADLYPKMGMRQMADNDILFDGAFRKEVKELFLSRGYECEIYEKSNHDVYRKNPVYNYEMHISLFGSTGAEAIKEYYKDPKKNLRVKSGFEREFSNEDFYIYFLAHGHKHFDSSGNGLRFLADCSVYLQKFDLDFEYVKTELQKMEIFDFEETVRTLSNKLFKSGEELTEEEKETLLYYAGAGTYGNAKIRVTNAIQKMDSKDKTGKFIKLKYLFGRVFPNQEWFEGNAPFFAKHRMLKPFFIVWRFVHGVAVRGKNILGEIKIVSKMQEEDYKKDK